MALFFCYAGYKNLSKIPIMDILRDVVTHGILDETVICKIVEMAKNQEYLNQHQYRHFFYCLSRLRR